MQNDPESNVVPIAPENDLSGTQWNANNDPFSAHGNADVDEGRAAYEKEHPQYKDPNEPTEGETNSRDEIMPHPSAPMEVSRAIIGDKYQGGDFTVLRDLEGSWMNWKATYWEEITERDVRKGIYRILDDTYYEEFGKDNGGDDDEPKLKKWNPDKRKVANIMDALPAVVSQNSRLKPPCWLDGYEGPAPASRMVACHNGLLDIGTRILHPHTPKFFNLACTSFDYDPAAPAPFLWLSFLKELWDDDIQQIEALQDWFGYILSGRTDLQKILLMVGPPRSGRGTIARTLTALIGEDNVVGPTLSSFGQNFGLHNLIGKSLAIVSDARLHPTAHSSVTVERLLSISGEDRQAIDRKFKVPWNGTLPTRIIIVSNELPKFTDASSALVNRFISLMLTRSWLDNEDATLGLRLLEELPGIFNWGLEGLERLTERGRFVKPKSTEDAVETMLDLGSPTSAFLRDCCERGPLLQVLCSTLYLAWRRWCVENGIEHPGNAASFAANLHAVVPERKIIQPREGDKRPRYYVGIALKDSYIPRSPSE
jgi:putative DNA primase/helicase